ncbi:MAG TPA: hypothetical protein VEA15_09845 [Caulobacteraceae bacterium]|nr:hypothetical protein [Caulobacteraceae bacterium]
MNTERFETLIAAYGAEPSRWPAAERDAAMAFMASDRAAAERLLFEARMIDAALDASPTPQVSHALRESILAAAPRPRPVRSGGFGWPAWLRAGAGLVAACAVGAAAGGLTITQLAGAAQADSILAQASDLPVDEQEFLG